MKKWILKYCSHGCISWDQSKKVNDEEDLSSKVKPGCRSICKTLKKVISYQNRKCSTQAWHIGSLCIPPHSHSPHMPHKTLYNQQEGKPPPPNCSASHSETSLWVKYEVYGNKRQGLVNMWSPACGWNLIIVPSNGVYYNLWRNDDINHEVWIIKEVMLKLDLPKHLDLDKT